MGNVFNLSGGSGGGIKLASIAITTPPRKTTYRAGETFDPAGMVVQAVYTNGAKAEATGYTFDPTTPLTDGTKFVTIKYTEGGATKTAVQSITVVHRLESIAVTTNPSKMTYEYGDAFSTAGMAVTATYSDGAKAAVTGYTTTPSALTTLGSQIVTVSYTEGGVTKTTSLTVTVERKTITTIPSQSGTLTYNGAAQSPVWNNYDSGKMTIAVTAQTNAGSYSASFTPKPNYRWADGTTTAKRVAWSIAKAAGSLSLSTSSVTLDSGHTSVNATVTRAGDGAISAKSNNTGVASVSISGNTVTIRGVNNTSGSATVTVSVAAGTNHTAPSSRNISVTAAFGPMASTSPKPGVSYTNGIDGLDADTVNELAKAISNNRAITKTTSVVYVDGENLHRKISVGDKIKIILSGTTYDFDIIGFNHDQLTSAAAYGWVTETGMAGMTMQMHNVLPTLYQMNTSQTNSGGWRNSFMRTSTMKAMKSSMPSNWGAIIKSVNKLSGVGGGASSGAETTSDECFLLAEGEIFGPEYGANGKGYSIESECTRVSQYAYYKAGNPKIKYKGGEEQAWWERSPSSSSDMHFCMVIVNGNAYTFMASSGNGVAFAFCV